ncbi:cardiolipin synthase [Noviherbaspirillum sedimenti]|uniref:Cardiolipin synthase n=1 Tax=Noviherbaspirillum sedimenti TaxID=2320865 RepID=A0A3A3FZJ9_9BURK|nr:cardiolipin synthase [Noviherbaspirillum sedimenti]RJG01593.1 cardiolipin synthase [Noviherbaspirillum sedimenti]
MNPGNKFNSVKRVVAALALALSQVACASLPDIDTLDRDNASQGRPHVAGQHGLLSPQKSAQILDRLQREGKTDLLDRHLEFMHAINPNPLITGNAVRVLIDGAATYRAMFDAIRAAQDHINLETYIYDEEGVGEALGKLLMEKQKHGVQVSLMYDSVGSLSTRPEFFQQLRQSGINVCEFNPVNPLRGKLFSLNHRDHRKILVVDGKIGFTGGINISSVYSRSSSIRRMRSGVPHPWRDTQIEVRGPAVREYQQLFLGSWQRQGCAALAQKSYFPVVQQQGDTIVRTLGSSPDDELNLIYVELLSAMTNADRSIHLTMAYFVPDAQTVAALKSAAQRGVDVRLVLPSVSDFRSTLHAARSYYSELLQAGVGIYERKDALLHAKTAVIDGVWSTVGSSNIDFRSFLYNDEVNTIVLGKKFAQQMEQMFDADVAASVRIDAARWEERGMAERIHEAWARMWAFFL